MRRALVLALLLAGCDQYAAPARTEGFASQSITLPAEQAKLPDTPAGQLVSERCLACHSADQITRQPKLKPEQWAATVKKMREVYKAPLAETDDAQTVAALVALQN